MNRTIKYFFFIILTIIIITCCEYGDIPLTKKPEKLEFGSLFEELSSEATGVTFANMIIETETRNINTYDYMYNGSGVAIGDINNDGLSDLFFSGNDASNRLYLNKGDFVFEDITNTANVGSDKWSTGVTMIDINNDGFLDIHVCNSGPDENNEKLRNDLFINNGDLTFTESAIEYGFSDTQYSTQANFFDFDKDGDLDMWLSNHGKRRLAVSPYQWLKVYHNELSHMERNKMNNALLINNNNRFGKSSSNLTNLNVPSFGLGNCIGDFNNDNYLDIFTTNDYFVPDYLYLNNKSGGFIESAKQYLKHTSFYSMGCDASDYNNDGILDIAVVDMTPSDHYRSKTLMESMDVNRFRILKDTFGYIPQYMFNSFFQGVGYGHFLEISNQLGVSKSDWSWAVLLADFDNDGFKDYFVTNGFLRDTKNQDYRKKVQEEANKIGKENFTDEKYFNLLKEADSNPVLNQFYKNENGITFHSGNSGIKTPTFSHGAAYGDLDNDGDLDLVINNLNSEATILRNNTNGHYLRMKLKDGTSTSSVLHSKVYLYQSGQMQRVDNSFIRGYQSTMEPIVHFGLPTNSTIDSIRIEWNDGSNTVLKDVIANSNLVINKQSQSLVSRKDEPVLCPLQEITEKVNNFNIRHTENQFDDFNRETLLPHKYSTLGPCIAVADINGDGLDDFFLGGAKGSPGQLLIQRKGEFIQSNKELFVNDDKYEDLGAHFFDFDSDGDLDLYVASGGGGDVQHNPQLLQDRLYINLGNGSFKKSGKETLPKISESTSVIKSFDYDNDGDLDLFIGCRNKPGKYPVGGQSYFLINDGNKFIDRTTDILPMDDMPGMITGVEAIDLNNDTMEDLLICGEWDAPVLLIHKEKSFVKENISSFLDLKGWWQSLTVADFDEDGDADFILGNIGLNNKFKPSKTKPIGILASDFDNNGTHDIVLTQQYNNKTVPVRGKECSSEQMPFINEKFPLYSSFASATIHDILPKSEIDNAFVSEVNYFSSIVLENKGNLSFEVKELPFPSQSAPLKGTSLQDFNNDGFLDVFIAGNIYNTEPETPSYDAGKGTILFGNGDCTFQGDHRLLSTGVICDKNVSTIESIKLGSKRQGILIANNDDQMQLFIHQ